MEAHCFFAHVAFATDARTRVAPQATANLLIEISDATLRSGGKRKHLKVVALRDSQKIELAAKLARSAIRDYLKSEEEFRKYPVQRFVDFNLTGTPTYISIRPPPTRVLPDESKVWRLAECESDKLRSKPLSVALLRTRAKGR